MEIAIRGALGTQLFEYLCGLDSAKKQGANISKVNINSGGKVVDPVKVDWLSQIIQVPYPVELNQGTAKQNVWKKPQVFESLSASGIIKDVKLQHKIKPNNYKILHVRGLDRTIASHDDYVKLVNTIGSDVKLIGDDNRFINNIIKHAGIGENISKGVIEDWHACIGAKEIYCAFTNFTLSALLFDPSKKFRMLSKQNSNGTVKIHDPAYACVNALFTHYFKNAQWL